MINDPPLHFDRAGQPIDADRWSQLRQDTDYIVVARTSVADADDTARGLVVSTVWVGLDLPGAPNADGGPPAAALIFETMVFDRAAWHAGQSTDARVAMRYATEDDARHGHRAVVRRLSATMEKPLTSNEAP